jgi:hypothetical protein
MINTRRLLIDTDYRYALFSFSHWAFLSFLFQPTDRPLFSWQDFDKFSHLIPKLWFEPFSTDSLEEGPALHDPWPQDEQPHM